MGFVGMFIFPVVIGLCIGLLYCYTNGVPAVEELPIHLIKMAFSSWTACCGAFICIVLMAVPIFL